MISFKILPLIALAALLGCIKTGSYSPSPEKTKAKTFVVIGNSMVYYGGMVQSGDQCAADPGIFSKMLKKRYGNDAVVYDCTYGDHQLADFATVCKREGNCTGKNHLAGIDFSSIDYVLISQAGNNVSTFVSDAAAVYNRFKKANPKVKLYYINHIYSCYKNHRNVLGNLKTLHDSLGVTIINCGQLAYDIYNGNVKVPGGSLTYKDRYTFVNHTSSDTYHPNPLMGYIMTQMAYIAVTSDRTENADYMTLLYTSKFGNGSVSYSQYTDKYYTIEAALPFTTVLDNKSEMSGIQKLIPQYINKF